MFQVEDHVELKPQGAEDIAVNKPANDYKVTRGSLLFSNPFMSMSTGTLKQYMETLKEINTPNFLIVPVDKSVYTGLEYSCIALCDVENENGKKIVHYYTVLLTATGRNPLTAAEFVESEIRAKQNNVKNREKFTYADVMNANLDITVRKCILQEVGKDAVLKNCDGMFFKGDIKSEHAARGVIIHAYNNIQNVKIQGKIGLDLVDIVNRNREENLNTRFWFNVESVYTDMYDDMGNIHHATFKAQFGQESLTNQDYALNSTQVNEVLVELHGFISPQIATRKEMMNGMEVLVEGISPNIVITNVVCNIPDTSSNILAIAVAGMMGNTNNWTKILMDQGDKMKLGALNFETKKYPNPNNPSKIPSINFGELAYEDKLDYIRRTFDCPPNISFDVTSNYTNNNLNFLYFAENISSNDVERAAIEGSNRDFEAGIKTLVRDKFDYRGNKIVSKITIPYGYVTNKRGECSDIRNITLPSILHATNGEDKNVVQFFRLMLAPNNPHAFTNYVEVIKNFYGAAVIESKTTRVTFNNAFINSLMKAVKDCVNYVENKNMFILPELQVQDYTAFYQSPLNTVGLNQTMFNTNDVLNYNYYNVNGYGGNRYF